MRQERPRPDPARAGSISLTMTSGIVATRLDAALAERIWAIGGRGQSGQCHLFLVARGTAVFRASDESSIELSGPALLWLPRRISGAFCLPAGIDGAIVSIAEDLVLRTASDSPVAAELLGLLGRIAIGPSERVSPHWGEISTIVAAIQRETRDPQPGGTAMLALNLGLVLLHLWRASGAEPSARQRGHGYGTFQSFLQLIEIHYRENLSIDDYAGLLGTSRAHLHEACLQTTGRTPLALVHERQIEEAKARLEQTRLTIEQVGFGLGFRDPGYFSRFFKRLTGVAPGAYRQSRRATRPDAPSSFAAWP